MIQTGRHAVSVQVLTTIPHITIEVKVQLEETGGRGINKYYMSEFNDKLINTLQYEILNSGNLIESDSRYEISYDAIIQIGRQYDFTKWKTLTLKVDQGGSIYMPFPNVVVVQDLNVDQQIDKAWENMENDFVNPGTYLEDGKPKKKFRSGTSREISDDYDFHQLIMYIYKDFIAAPQVKQWLPTRDGRFRSLRAFNIFGEQLLSFQYSDFSQKNIQLSQTYGLCLFECLEYIRYNGNVQEKFIYEKNLFQQETFFQKLRQINFTNEEIKTILSGQLFDSCSIYKRKFKNIQFAIYISYTDEIYYYNGIRLIKYEKWNENEKHSIQIFNKSKWWLVYEKMHVVPMLGEQIIKFIQKRDTIASNFKYLNKFLIKGQFNINEQNLARQSWIEKNQRINKTFYLSKSICENTLRKKFHKLKIKSKTFSDFCIQNQFSLLTIDNGIHFQNAKQQQLNKIDKCGVIAFDFETVKDNSVASNLVGNMRAIVIVCQGYYYYDSGVMNKNGDKSSRVKKQVIDKVVFDGDTCVDNFVQWIIDSKILLQGYLSKKNSHTDNNPAKYLRQYKNYFIAHNGARFDFKFIINKLAKFAQLDITGTKNQIRKLKFKNVEFLDSFQLLPFSLKKLCDSFKPVNKKFPYDIENVTVDNWREKYNQIVHYCHMDCKSLYEIYMKYITSRATMYHNNTAFPKKLFPMTQSQAALDVMQSGYLEETLEIYEDTYDFELSSYFGGAVCVYEPMCKYGATYDANSMYPSVMHQNVPFKPIFQGVDNENPYLIIHEQPIIISQEGKDYVDNCDLFYCEFTFPQNCKYPSITIRNSNGTLITPLESKGQKVWIWGITVNVAVQRQNCEIKIFKQIQYQAKPIFNKFIVQMFKDRKTAQANGDSLNDFLIKLLMNSSYGKLGQKINPQSFHGTQQQILEFVEQQLEKDNGFEIMSVVPLLVVGHQIYEMKYVENGLKYSQIGGLCRFASYITASARANLYRATQIIQDELGQYYPQSNVIVYCDTDSLAVKLDKGFSQDQIDVLDKYYKESEQLSQQVIVNKKQIETFEKQIVLCQEALSDDYVDIQKNQEKIQYLIELNKQIFESLKNNYSQIKLVYQQNPLYQKIQVIQDFDARDFNGFQLPPEDRMGYQTIPLLDEDICGAYKQEKFVIQGYFLGAKFYTMKSLDTKSNGLLLDICKMKGVQEFNRRFEHYQQMYHSIYDINIELNLQGINVSTIQNYVKMYEQQQFRALDGGVRIQNMLKIIVPTLTKRVYYRNELNEWTSRAFNDMTECEIIQARVYDLNNQIKAMYKQSQIIQQQIIDNKQQPENQVVAKDNFIFTQIKKNSELKLIQEQEDLNILASPVYITKITFFNLVEQYFGNNNNQQQLRNIYIDSKQEYFQQFQLHISQQNCKNYELNCQIVFIVYFMANICKFMTQQRQSFQNLIVYIENKIQKVINKKKQWFNLNNEFVNLIMNDHQQLEKYICDELKQQINYDHIQNNEYYMTKHFQSQIISIHKMQDQQIAQQYKNFSNLTSQKIAQKYNKMYEIKQQFQIIYEYLISLNSQQMRRLNQAFRVYNLQFSSKRKCMLLVIRNFILEDTNFLYGTWDTQNNYSKMNKKNGMFIDKFADLVINSTAVNQDHGSQQQDEEFQLRMRNWQQDWDQFISDQNNV